MMQKKSVLVIDDQESWRNLVCELLEDEFDVKSASNYREALDVLLAQKPPFHVVVSDIRLVDDEFTNEDGLRLVEEMNQLGNLTKVIIITGYPSIETAKRALGKLAVYDYLEKRPSDGHPFDSIEFRRIVSEAAEEAEWQRPDTLHVPQRTLIIEPDAAWRETLSRVLCADGYRVDESGDAALLYDQNNPHRKFYDLLVVNETFLDERFFDFQRGQPNTKIIVLTGQTFAALLRKIQEHAAISAFPLQPDFEADEFRKTVRRAFASEITKYVIATIEGVPEPKILYCGKTYRLILGMSELYLENAISVELAPRTAKGERLTLTVFVYAPQVKFQNTQFYWRIPVKGRLLPLELEFVPEETGDVAITIELEQDNRWLGRIERRIQIRNIGDAGENRTA